jgi:hypothetical protein
MKVGEGQRKRQEKRLRKGDLERKRDVKRGIEKESGEREIVEE